VAALAYLASPVNVLYRLAPAGSIEWVNMIDVAIPQIAQELHLTQGQVQATVGLLDDGTTVPFIARYRKEATASLDEVAITNIRHRLSRLRELRDRQGTILGSLEERGLLIEELRKAVLSAETMATLEDIYLPYRPKRRTRATIARERGLEPLALRLWDQQDFEVNLAAVECVDRELGVETVEDALGGARDIIAEWVNEETTARGSMRKLFWSQGTFSSRVVSGKASEAAKYRDYFEWEEPVIDVPSHRLLAMLRGEREALLSTHIAPPVSQAIAILEGIFVTGETEASQQVRLAVEDSYQRLLEASMETEVRREARVRAEDTAIRVFANNLRELLLAPALRQKNVLALDPDPNCLFDAIICPYSILPTSHLIQRPALPKIAVIYMVKDRLALGIIYTFIELGGQASV